MRQPNPLDPLDGFKRWYTELWPMQRVGVILGISAAAVVLVLWATR